MDDVVYLSRADERANTITHAAGFVLSLLTLPALLTHPDSPSPALMICCSVFSVAMACVYFCSTMSHAVYEPRRRHRWRAWDQGMIYAMISGTYTPFIWAGSPEGFRVPLLAAVWTAAVVGFYSKVLAAHRINGISTVTYILLGWLPAIPLFQRTPNECLLWMLAGGIAYTAGIGFLHRDARYKYFHALWHVMVIIGSGCHFVAIYRLIALSTT